jgi:hypothetical protein
MIFGLIWAYWSTHWRTVRAPLLAGFLCFTAGIGGLASIQPDQSISALAFAALAGIGFGAPLILIVTGVQLATPHHLIATATSVTTSARAVAATVFTAIYAAAFTTRLDGKLPNYVASAAINAGLPPTSVKAFVSALLEKDQTALMQIPGISLQIIGAGAAAAKQAFADSLRVVYLIAVPFGVLACIGCLFLGDFRTAMTYRVDAPVEELYAKRGVGSNEKAVAV